MTLDSSNSPKLLRQFITPRLIVLSTKNLVSRHFFEGPNVRFGNKNAEVATVGRGFKISNENTRNGNGTGKCNLLLRIPDLKD